MYKTKNWNFTRRSFLYWLDNCSLKKRICEKVKIDQLSVWWISKLVDKDIVLQNHMNLNLKDKLNNKNYKTNKFIYLQFLIKLIKNFFKNIIFITIIKLLYKKSINKSKNKKNCYFSMYNDLVFYKKETLNGCFSFAPLNKKKNNCYLVNLNLSFELVKDYFKIKKKLSKLSSFNHILYHYINFTEIFHIYIKTVISLFKTLRFANSKYFLINNKNCSDILRPKLFESFFGDIQDTLIISKAVKNFLKDNDYDNFITNGEFYPHFRSIYHHIKTLKNNTKIITVNHADYHQDNLFLYLNKKDFSKRTDKKYRSPEPDIFFSQGTEYAKYLKNIFPHKKVFIVGSFKFDFANSVSKKTTIRNILRKNDHEKNKKILVVLTSLKDEDYLVHFLNKCDLARYLIVLCAHPVTQYSTEKYFKKNFNFSFVTLKKYHSREVIEAADLIVSGYASLAYEAFFRKLNVIRVEDYFRPNWVDKKDYIPLIKSPKDFNKYIEKSKKVPKNLLKKIEKKYFFKFDQKTSQRFCKIIEKLK